MEKELRKELGAPRSTHLQCSNGTGNCLSVPVESTLYPNGVEAKSACDRLSSLSYEARLDKRQGAAHQHDPKAAGLSLGMATKGTLV